MDRANLSSQRLNQASESSSSLDASTAIDGIMESSQKAFPTARERVLTGPWLHIALLIVIAVALTYPNLQHGLPLGHDSNSHIRYQHFFNEQISSGDLYPRWMPGLNRGLGGGIFFVQFPLPYYVACGIGRTIPNHWGVYLEARSQGLALVLATILAALFAYAWCATFSDRLSAAAAATVYVTLPYFLAIDLYMRVAVGEFWAFSVLPASFYFIELMIAGSRRALPGLTVVFALVILSHIFTAVLLAPVLLTYAIWRAENGRRIAAAVQTTAAFILAGGVAGVYTLPFLVHRHFMHPLNFIPVFGANYSPLSQMFSYNKFTFPTAEAGWHHLSQASRLLGAAIIAFIGVNWFNSRKVEPRFLRMLLAALSILVLGMALLAGHFHSFGEVPGALPLPQYLVDQRAKIFLCSFLTMEATLACYWWVRSPRHRSLTNFLMVLGLASYLMMTSWSFQVWKRVTFLWNLQFPWRMNVFVAVAATGLAALAFAELRVAPPPRRFLGVLAALTLWSLVAVGVARVGDVRRAFESRASLEYQENRDNALPIYTQVDPKQALLVQPAADRKVHVTFEQGSGSAEVTSVQPRLISFNANCANNCTLQIGQFYYPAWRATDSPTGAKIPLRPTSPGGLMEVSLPAGEYSVQLELPRGWSEQVGFWVSLASMLLAAILALGVIRNHAGNRPRTTYNEQS